MAHNNVYSLYKRVAAPSTTTIYKKLEEALESEDSKFYIMLKGNDVYQFLKIVDAGDCYELGSVNGRPEIKGFGVGAPFILLLLWISVLGNL